MKDANNILIRPHITEKATFSSERGVYVFEVTQDATKAGVAHAIKNLYKVTPVKIRTVSIPAKRVFVRGKYGSKSGYKKAYVYLAKGQKLES